MSLPDFSTYSKIGVASIAASHERPEFRAAATAYMAEAGYGPVAKGKKTPQRKKKASGPLSFREAIDKYGTVIPADVTIAQKPADEPKKAPVDPTLPPVSDPKFIDPKIVEPIKDPKIIDDAT